MKQILFSECIPNFLLYECFAMHMMKCQVLMLGQNTRGVTMKRMDFLVFGSNRYEVKGFRAYLTGPLLGFGFSGKAISNLLWEEPFLVNNREEPPLVHHER